MAYGGLRSFDQQPAHHGIALLADAPGAVSRRWSARWDSVPDN